MSNVIFQLSINPKNTDDFTLITLFVLSSSSFGAAAHTGPWPSSADIPNHFCPWFSIRKEPLILHQDYKSLFREKNVQVEVRRNS